MFLGREGPPRRLLILLTVPPASRRFHRPICMINLLIRKIVGSQNERQVKKMRPLVSKINEIEAALQSLPEEELRQKTAAWKAELSEIKDDKELAQRLEE